MRNMQMNNVRRIAALLPPLAALVLLVSGCGGKVKPGTAEVKRQVVTGVVITEAGPSQVEDYYETSGTVKAKTISMVASRVMGTVTSLPVREGQRVRFGQVLMTVDDRDGAERVKAAKQALDAARQQRALADVTDRRYKRLYDEKVIARQEIDQIETQKKVAESECERAKAMLAEARVNYGFSRITAPVSGVVTEKKIERGSTAVPGAYVLTIEDDSAFTIEINPDEGLSSVLRTGMPAQALIEPSGTWTDGRITEVIPAIDPMSRTFLAKIAVKGRSLRTGLYAKVRIPVGKKEAIVVPEGAIVEKGQLTGVYAVDGKGIITYRLVRTGKRYGDSAEILSGINPGDRIITGGVSRAVDGGIIAGAGK